MFGEYSTTRGRVLIINNEFNDGPSAARNNSKKDVNALKNLFTSDVWKGFWKMEILENKDKKVSNTSS